MNILNRFLKPGWLALLVILLIIVFRLFHGARYELHKTVTLGEGETIQELYDDMGMRKRGILKRYMRTHDDEVKLIQPGSYVFSGIYTPADILDVFQSGPTYVYENITLLEGWGMYDIDAKLAEKGLIQAGEYIELVTDAQIIETYSQRYDFLAQAVTERGSLSSLEGYLYPDTYYVNAERVLDDLLYLQLEAFDTKIWQPYGEQLRTLSSRLEQLGYDFSLSTYGALIVASIIEKEERVDSNRPSIASVFFNRINEPMLIGADISLCYGLQEPYSTCTPSVIVNNLYDTDNPYNTRAVSGLPPTPIVSPTASSVQAVVTAEPTQWFYYLHANDGTLHLARTLGEHNNNKSKYLSQ